MKCPRRKIKKAEFYYTDGHIPSWKLTLECGHIDKRIHHSRHWNHPKTTQCGACWRGETMTRGIYNLLADNKPLPKGTLLKTMTGEFKELSEQVLESANRLPNHMSDYVPFWILGWKDLHTELKLPEEL